LIFAGIGFAQGAIRTAISLAGLIVALMVAVPFGHVLQPLLGMVGVKNPVWLALIPPVVAFFIVYLTVMGLSFFAHHKVYLHYKYKRDDADRMRWERMNRHVGATVGVLCGAILFLAISGVIYAAGYLTVQLSAEENNPATIKFINSVRQDMADSGFDKAAAKFQPASKVYYDAADVLGLLYHNPLLQSRLVTYPHFLSLGERTEFQEIGTDKEYNDLIFGKAPVTQIIEHPRTQGLLGNSEIMTYLKTTDLPDLKQYLLTGKSAKYEGQDILGMWDLDKSAVLTHIRKSNPDIKARDLRLIKQALESVPPVTMVATPENKVIIKSAAPAPPAEAAPEQPAQDQAAADLAARYGPEYARRMRGENAPAQPAAPAPAETVAPPIPTLTGEGTWSEEGLGYAVAFNDASGKQVKGTARIKADEMLLTFGDTSLVFVKQ
jgi:hypothetical protein